MKIRKVLLFVVFACLISSCGKSKTAQSPTETGNKLSVSSDEITQLEQVKRTTPKPATREKEQLEEENKTVSPPLPDSDLLILQDFEPGNGTEDFDIYTWDYGKARPEVISRNAYKGKRCVATRGDMVGFNFIRREVDMMRYKNVFVYVLDNNGNNTIEITLRDMDDNEHKVWSTQKSRQGKWTRVSVPLSKFKNKIDLSRVKNIQIYEWSKGKYYFDNVGISK